MQDSQNKKDQQKNSSFGVGSSADHHQGAAVFKPKGGRGVNENRGIKSMFNVPLSVRGIKQIKIDDDIKKQQAAKVNSQNTSPKNSNQNLNQDGQLS